MRVGSNVKEERFGLIMSAKELSALRYLAVISGDISMAAVIRHLLRDAARRHRVWGIDEDQFQQMLDDDSFDIPERP